MHSRLHGSWQASSKADTRCCLCTRQRQGSAGNPCRHAGKPLHPSRQASVLAACLPHLAQAQAVGGHHSGGEGGKCCGDGAEDSIMGGQHLHGDGA